MCYCVSPQVGLLWTFILSEEHQNELMCILGYSETQVNNYGH